MIELGREYRDKVSGFVGVAVANTTWLNGCVRICLQPKIDKDGKHQDSCTFDVEQLEPTSAPKIDVTARNTGGPMPDAVRAADPKR